MSLAMDIAYTSLAGAKPVNEDFAGAMLPEEGQEAMGVIAAIADGVSAGGLGRDAAQTSVTTLVRDYYGTPQSWDTPLALDRLITAQNAWLAASNRRSAPAVGLTTLTALVLRGAAWTLAHVGDTRAYLLREGQVTQLTVDHVMSRRDAPYQLTRVLGAEDPLVVDFMQGELQVGDVFILLSDGVHRSLRLRQLAEMAELAQAQAIADSLVQAAIRAGSHDNATALVVRVLGLMDATLPGAPRLPVPVRLNPGDVIDGLRVEERVADNGVRLLYRVHDQRSGQDYALKTLHPSRAYDADQLDALGHEAWLGRHLQHTGAAGSLRRLHAGPPGGKGQTALYLLYDWYPGETLAQMLARKHRFAPAQVVDLATQVLQALGRLHRQSVVHRDLQPTNLHLGTDGVLRLLDLGVALSGREPAALRELHAGTPSHVNPEQWGFALRAGGVDTSVPPEAPDAQSDLFAVGVTLYQLLTDGKLPYGEVLPYQSGRYYRDPQSPSRYNPEVPIWLDHVVLKAVARDKRQRFETAEEFLLALERGASRPLTAPPASPLMQRDPAFVWKLLFAVSALFNVLLIYWLLFLPK
ncbi:MAG: bifunctional protein-serine/threonine kinase/phosphatase [Hylemonella sp.]|uniref:bifunctional protein-serine/threonine kinase/phosphatase n=1 Tax=Hylemonella sp. TaxID=2066020 RepID=UPI0022C4ACA6|nr:bifunctional protein-serine/threonine kinase/phosphatase [Hylemonella sp.]MCZ8252097.1 bifunctional protein-serine/threonine kinase/phosphatase [Hylemonella sp.]